MLQTALAMAPAFMPVRWRRFPCVSVRRARGVDLPHVNEHFETNVQGMYIAGELGGMGLIKNSVEQGQQAIENMLKRKKRVTGNVLDVVIVGAGPAGISASLAAKQHGLNEHHNRTGFTWGYGIYFSQSQSSHDFTDGLAPVWKGKIDRYIKG